MIHNYNSSYSWYYKWISCCRNLDPVWSWDRASIIPDCCDSSNWTTWYALRNISRNSFYSWTKLISIHWNVTGQSNNIVITWKFKCNAELIVYYVWRHCWIRILNFHSKLICCWSYRIIGCIVIRLDNETISWGCWKSWRSNRISPCGDPRVSRTLSWWIFSPTHKICIK